MIKINIYKRGNTWTYIIEGPRVNGKRNRLSKGGFKTKKEAQQEATFKQNELNLTGDIFKTSDILLSEVCDKFLDYQKNLVRESTLKLNKHNITIILNYFKDIKIKDISTLEIQKFINFLQQNYKISTLKIIYARLKQIFNFAINILEILATYPKFDKIIVPKESSIVREDILMENDINFILNCSKDTIYYYLFQVAIFTGLRRGEILALTWSDINLEKYTININKSINDYNIIGKTKNISSTREIAFSDNLKNIFVKIKNFPENKLFYDIDKNNKVILSNENKFDFIFREKSGIRVSVGMVNKLFTTDRELGKYHFHQFRHYHATKLLESGIPINLIAKRLGHSKISTTLNMYIGVCNFNHEIISKLDLIFGQQIDNK